MGMKGIKKVTNFGVDGLHSSISLNNFLSEDDCHDKKINTEKMASASSSCLLDMLADVATQQSLIELQDNDGPESKWVLDEKVVVEEFIKFCAQKARQERVLAGKDGSILGFGFNGIYIPKKKRSAFLRIKRRTFIQFGSMSTHLPVNVKQLKRKREFKSDQNKNLKKKQKRVQVETEKLEPPPDLPPKLKDKIRGMNGGDLKLVIQKKLCASDLSNNNSRFSIPMIKVISPDFLKEKEKSDLDIRTNKQLVGIPVLMLNPSDLSFNSLRLKKWKMGENDVYNLVSGWIKVAKATQLEQDEIVQLWSFRLDHDSRLYFVLVKVKNACSTPEEAHHQQTSSTCGAGLGKSSISGGSTSCLSNELCCYYTTL